MLDASSLIHLKGLSEQKKRKRRGHLLFSSKCVLERSRMRVSKYMSRLNVIDKVHVQGSILAKKK